MYDSCVEFVGTTKLVDNRRTLLTYNATIWFMGNTISSNCITTDQRLTVTCEGLAAMPYGDGGGAVIFELPDNLRKHHFLCSTVLYMAVQSLL